MTGRALWGIFLIVLGTLFLLEQLDVAETGEILGTWWPMILVVLGGWGLITSSGRNLGALILLVVGAALQVDQLELLDTSVWEYAWPVGLILLGLWVLFRRSGGAAPWSGVSSSSDADDRTTVVAMLGGQDRRITSRAWRGGDVTAIMGGVELHLGDALPVEGGARLEVTAIMGGVDVFVPEGWEVDVRGTPFLGAVEDSRRRRSPVEGGPAPRLRIDATAIMGGVEINDA